MKDQRKRRFRYLFRRENRVSKEQVKDKEDMGYLFPAVADMSSAEIDKEIKLRVQALQAKGILPVLEKVEEVQQEKPRPPTKIEKLKKAMLKRPEFKPRFFIKRSKHED